MKAKTLVINIWSFNKIKYTLIALQVAYKLVDTYYIENYTSEIEKFINSFPQKGNCIINVN